MPSEAHIEPPDVVAHIRARDPDIIRQVVEDNFQPIYRAARSTGLGDQEAEDVCQATFVTFVETAPRFEGRSRVRTWLFGILYRKLAEMRRHQQKERQIDDIDEIFESRFAESGRWRVPPDEAERPLIAGELRTAIDGCLQKTPLKQRMAFLLREVEGLTTDEICSVLGVSSSNFGVLLFRARNRLRECLEARGVKP